MVEKWIPDPKGRLLRLRKYTRGEAHDMIKHCLQEPSYIIGYTHAQGLLRCGNENVMEWQKHTTGMQSTHQM